MSGQGARWATLFGWTGTLGVLVVGAGALTASVRLVALGVVALAVAHLTLCRMLAEQNRRDAESTLELAENQRAFAETIARVAAWLEEVSTAKGWICRTCVQLNATLATECGRCGAPAPGRRRG